MKNISKKPLEEVIFKNNSKTKINANQTTNKSNTIVNSNNNEIKKEEESIIFKDKSPMMFNRSKNNFYSNKNTSILKSSNIGKFNVALNNNQKYANNDRLILNPDKEIPDVVKITKNINVKSYLSSNISNNKNNPIILLDNLHKINSDNLSKKTLLSQKNDFCNEVNQDTNINESLKRELDLLKTELSIANLVIKINFLNKLHY
jgi:hypothetical protein